MKRLFSIHNINRSDINNKQDVIDTIKYMVHMMELVFHPDTPFADYVNIQSGEPTFNTYDITQGQAIIDRLFDICEEIGEDIYRLCEEALPFLTKVLITVEGGIVQNVSADSINVLYTVVDFDDNVNAPENDVLIDCQQANYIRDGKFHEQADKRVKEKLKEIGF